MIYSDILRLTFQADGMDPTEMATRVAAAMGWDVKPDEIEMKDVSGKGGAQTFRVSAPLQPPVALHIRCSGDTPVTVRRLEAANVIGREMINDVHCQAG